MINLNISNLFERLLYVNGSNCKVCNNCNQSGLENGSGNVPDSIQQLQKVCDKMENLILKDNFELERFVEGGSSLVEEEAYQENDKKGDKIEINEHDNHHFLDGDFDNIHENEKQKTSNKTETITNQALPWKIIAFTDKTRIPISKIWYHQVESLGYQVDQIKMISLDNESYQELKSSNISTELVSSSIGSKSTSKTELVLKYLKSDQNVLISDLTTIFINYKKLEELPLWFDIFHAKGKVDVKNKEDTNSSNDPDYNNELLAIRSNPNTISMLESINSFNEIYKFYNKSDIIWHKLLGIDNFIGSIFEKTDTNTSKNKISLKILVLSESLVHDFQIIEKSETPQQTDSLNSWAIRVNKSKINYDQLGLIKKLGKLLDQKAYKMINIFMEHLNRVEGDVVVEETLVEKL